MKTIKLILVALVVSFSAQVNAQTAEEIINNYFENTGGVDAWNKIEGLKMTAKVNFQGMEIPVEIVNLKNGKQYTKVNFQGKEMMQGVFDGETLWGSNFMTQKAEKSDKETTDNFKNDSQDFNSSIITGGFINYKEKGYTIELVGKEEFEGTETFKIKLTKTPLIVDGKEEDNVSFYYFDTENYVPIAMQAEVKFGQAKGMITEIKVSDYDESNGIYFPFSMTQGVKDGPGGQSITIEKIEINPEVDDKLFMFPEEEETTTTEDKKN